jgi:two-component system chemotaxis sensor kinase CheA
MNGIDIQLTERIDRALRTENFDASLPDASATLEELFGAVGEFLAQPVSADARSAASKIAEISHSDALDPSGEGEFRAALLALREAVEAENEQRAAADQFASDPELVQEFLVEAREHLATVESNLLLLERDPANGESLNGVFRSFHTIKGLAGFLGAAAIQELAHETENVLSQARAGKIFVSRETIDLILRAADEMTRYLDKGSTQKLNELPRCNEGLLHALEQAARGAPATPVTPSTAPLPEKADDGARAAPGGVESHSVRVETAKLEYLIDMVGELVIAESVVRHHPAIGGAADPLLSRNLAQLLRVVQEVQKTSMSMRMVAVGTLFRKMSRLTRDLARKSEKTVELILTGEEVELDRGIVEELADPLVHMVRNAMDHGIETPAERTAAGKPAQGTVRLRALHDAGDIVIEISDDGRGMDPAKLLAKARRQGLVGEQETPDEEAILRLIFEPGFSTAEKVTDLSGRGVGMDVVRKQIQKLRGRVAIRSAPGRGSVFTLRVPLTLAIIDGLVVGVGAQRYILPMFAVREMFSPKPDTLVTLENRAEAALFRDKLLPVIRLSRLLEDRAMDRAPGVLIVVESREQLCCIAVDQLIGKQEVVIKSLGTTFRDVPAISGGAILGDGRVGLIIDVNTLRYRNGPA